MEAGSAGIPDRTTDRTDIHRAREENYRVLYTNIRFVAYLRTAIIVFVLYLTNKKAKTVLCSVIKHARK